MKMLIIGSKGFIGSHCVSFFSKKYNVFQADTHTDYTTKNYFTIDGTNSDYNEIFQKNNFDICINCSGAANVSDSIKKPLRDFTLNTTNVFKQLESIRKYNPNCKYINLSSAAVYGNPKNLPIYESNELNPISPYGLHKKMAEEICNKFYKLFAVKTCSLRIFSAYGPGLKKQLFWDLSQKKIEPKIEIFGSGEESRDYIYILDLVKVIEIVIKKSEFCGNTINVANGEEIKIRDAVNTFFQYFNPNVNIEFNGQIRVGDPANWKADISKLKKLGYKKEFSFIDGIKQYVKWVQEKK